MPFTLQPNEVYRGHVPTVPHTATVVVQPALDNQQPNYRVVVRHGEYEPSRLPKDLLQREITGKTVRTIHWYATTTWAFPRIFVPVPWTSTHTFNLNGGEPGDLYEISNEGPTDIVVTLT